MQYKLPMLDFVPAAVNGIRMGYLEHVIEMNPLTSGDLRQRATKLDATAVNYSKFGWKTYEAAKSFIIRVLSEKEL